MAALSSASPSALVSDALSSSSSSSTAVAVPSFAAPHSSPSSPDTDAVVEHELAALEEQLHRLLQWKSDAKERRVQLQSIEQRLAHAVAEDERAPLLSRHRSLQSAVATDTEHRPYWRDQVRLVQQRIRAQLDAAGD